MNGYYIHEKFVKGASIGVENKVCQQIEEFSKYFKMKELEISRIPGHALTKRLFFYDRLYNIEEIVDEIEAPGFLYIRKPIIDRSIIKLLKYVKDNFPQCKIILELFTYPYDLDCYLRKELFLANFMYFIKEAYYRQRLKLYVDRIVTFSKDTNIWGIPAIQTQNGIDVHNCPLHKKKEAQKDAPIHLISVAGNQIHHGYDRLIKGLARYYKENNSRIIYYHIVGEGKELKNYKRLVKEHNVDDYVFFCGNLYGKELEEEYEKCDLAIASIGMHRIKLKFSSTLKTKEYLAKGIPFIYAGDIDVITAYGEVSFALQIPYDDSDVDMKEIITFIDNLYEKNSKEELSMAMRTIAENTIGIDVVMKEIIDFIRLDSRK